MLLNLRRSLGGKPSILRNLTWGLILTVTLVLALFNLFFYLRSINQIEEQLRLQATDIAARSAGVLGVPMWNFDNVTIQQIAEVYTNLDEVAFLSIQDDQGNILYSRNKETSGAGTINRTAEVLYEGQVIGQVNVAISNNSIQNE